MSESETINIITTYPSKVSDAETINDTTTNNSVVLDSATIDDITPYTSEVSRKFFKPDEPRFPDVEPDVVEAEKEIVSVPTVDIDGLMDSFMSTIRVYKMDFKNKKRILKASLLAFLIALDNEKVKQFNQDHEYKQLLIDSLDLSLKQINGLDSKLDDAIDEDNFEEIFDAVVRIVTGLVQEDDTTN